MGKFAFITHPDRAEDIKLFLPPARYLPLKIAEGLGGLLPPLKVAEIRAESSFGRAEGFIISVNRTSRRLEAMTTGELIYLIAKAGRIAQSLGAEHIGLGGCAGQTGIELSRVLGIPVIGESGYNIATAMDSLEDAYYMMGQSNKNMHAAVLGATLPSGRAASLILSRRVRSMTLVDGNKTNINELAGKILFHSGLSAGISTDPPKAVRSAGLVVVVRNTEIEPRDLAPGTVLCDLSRPPLLGRRIAAARDDVLVIEGAVVKLPGQAVNYSEPGYPPGLAGPYLAETIMLAMEGKAIRRLTAAGGIVDPEMLRRLAGRHGFARAGLKGPGGFVGFNQLKNFGFQGA